MPEENSDKNGKSIDNVLEYQDDINPLTQNAFFFFFAEKTSNFKQ